MLSEEEKQAIQYLNKYCDTDLFYEQRHYNYIKMIIRLIGKQSKEIEELKEIYQTGYVNGCVSKVYEINKKWKDKIKAKMKEKEWSLENYDCTKSDYKQSQAIGAWVVLQSLLEKE